MQKRNAHSVGGKVRDGGHCPKVPLGTFSGGDSVPPGTFHGGDSVPPGTFH